MATETLQVKAVVDGVNAFVSDVGKAAKSVQDAGKKIETAAKDFDSATGNVEALGSALDSTSSAAKAVKLDPAGKQAKDVGSDFEDAAPQVESINESFDKTQEGAEALDLSPAGENAEETATAIADAGETAEGFTESLETVETGAGAFDVSEAQDEAETVAQGISDAGDDAEGFTAALDGIEHDAGDFDVSAASDSAEETARDIGDAGEDAEPFSESLADIEDDADDFDVSSASDTAEETAADIGDAGEDAERFTDSLDTIEQDAGAFDVSAAEDTAVSTAQAIGDAGTDAERFSDSLDTVAQDADAFDVSAASDSAESTAQAIGDAGEDAERFTESLDIIEGDADAFDPSAAADSAEQTATDVGDAGEDAERFSESLFTVEDDANDFDVSEAADTAESTAQAIGDAGEDAERFTDSLDTVEDSADTFDVSSARDSAEDTASAIGDAGADAEPFAEALEDIETRAQQLDLSAASAEADTTASDFSEAASGVAEMGEALEEIERTAEGIDLTSVEDSLGGVKSEAESTGSTFDTVGTSATTMGTLMAGAGAKAGGLGGNIVSLKGAVTGIISTAAFVTLSGQIRDMAEAAAADEQATMRLETAVRNSHEPFNETIGIIDTLIARGEALAFTDDEVRNSFINLLTATDSAAEAQNRLVLAFDFARGAGISLEGASRLLGKINAENVDVFKKLGIELDNDATEMDALAVVHEKFGGSAAAHVDTVAGSWERFSIKVDEAREKLGYIIIEEAGAIQQGDAAEKSTTLFGRSMELLGGKTEGAGKILETMADSIFPGASTAFRVLKVDSDDTKGSISGLNEAFDNAAAKVQLARDKWVAAHGPLGLLNGALQFGRDTMQDYRDAVADADQALADLKSALQEVEDEFISNNPVVIAAKGQIALYKLELNDLKTKSGELTTTEQERIGALESSIGVLEDVIAKEQGHADAIQDTTAYLATFVGNAGMGKVISVLKDGETSLNNQTKYVADLGQAFLNAKSGGIDAAIAGMETLQSNLGPMSAEWQAIAQEVGPKFISTLRSSISDPGQLATIDAAAKNLGIVASTGVESTTPDMTDAGTLLVTTAKEAVEAGAPDLENAGMILGQATDTGLKSLADALSTSGVELGTSAQTGVESTSGQLTTAGALIAEAAKSGAGSVSLTPTGEAAGTGFGVGLQSREGYVRSVAAGLANMAKNIMNTVLGVSSPAEETIYIGEMTARGLEVGMTNRITFVNLATDKLMDEGIIDPLTAKAMEIEDIGTAIGLDTTEAIRFAFETGADDAYDQLDTFLGDILEQMGGGRAAMELEATRSVLDVVDAFADRVKYKPGTDQMFEFAHEMVVVLRDAPLPATAKTAIQNTISTIMADLHAGKIDAAAAMAGVKDAMLDILLEAEIEIPAQASAVNDKIIAEMMDWIGTLKSNFVAGKEMSKAEINSMFNDLSTLIDNSTLGPKSKAMAEDIINEFVNGLKGGQGVANQAVIDFINYMLAQIDASVPNTGGGSGGGTGGGTPGGSGSGQPPGESGQTAESLIYRATGIWPSQYGWNTPFSQPVFDDFGNKIGARVADWVVNETGVMQVGGVLTLGPDGKPQSGYWAGGKWHGQNPPVYLGKGGFIMGERGNEAVLPLDRFYEKIDALVSTTSMIALNTKPVPTFGGPRSATGGSSIVLDMRGSHFGSDAVETASAIERMIDRRFDAGIQRHMMGALRNGVRAK